MLTDSIPRQIELKLALRGRNQADLLLDRLLRDRRLSERRLAAAGKHDPLKRLTGTSSLDRAIESTRAIIRTVDARLYDLRRDGALSSAPARANGVAVMNGTTGAVGGAHADEQRAIVVTVGEPKVSAGASP